MFPVKPLNVLTVSASLPVAGRCIPCKSVISELLHRDRYTVYGVSSTELEGDHWKESTKAVVVPSPGSGGPDSLTAKIISQLKDFLLLGGRLLSFHPQVNAAFGFCLSAESHGLSFSTASNLLTFVCDQKSIDVREEFSCPLITGKVQPRSSDGVCSPDPAQRTTLLEAPPIGAVVEVVQWAGPGGEEGVALLSYVDLCPELSGLDMEALGRIKESTGARRAVLSALLTRLSLECQPSVDVPLSWSYLLGEEENVKNLLSLLEEKGSSGDYTLEVVERDSLGGVPVDCHPSDSKLCILSQPTEGEFKGIDFNTRKFFSELKTQFLGRTMMYTPVITSTHTFFTKKVPLVLSLPKELGLVSVAGRQTKGKGRSGNVWLSPEGCMMFSLSLNFPPSSAISGCVSILQHLIGTAIVHAVRSMPGYETLDLRVKWPNDIYYSRKVKLGGVLVNCLAMGHEKVAICGVGVNVTNQYPTLSLNDCVNLHNTATSSHLEPLSVERLLARTLGVLEELVRDMESTLLCRQMEDTVFMSLYYKYWLHGAPDNTVYLEQTGEHVTITGIDQYGYLLVRDQLNKITSLHTDGNSFDMMKGLIKAKP